MNSHPAPFGASNDTAKENKNPPKWQNPWVLAVFALLYFISPIDPIPDIIPIAGLLDDVAVVGWVVKTILANRKKGEDGNA